jgi:hypothetical protein
LVGKPEGKRQLGRRRLRWEDNIKMDLSDIAWEGVAWVDLPRSRDKWWAVVDAVMNLGFCKEKGNLMTSVVAVSFSRSTLPDGTGHYSINKRGSL